MLDTSWRWEVNFCYADSRTLMPKVSVAKFKLLKLTTMSRIRTPSVISFGTSKPRFRSHATYSSLVNLQEVMCLIPSTYPLVRAKVVLVLSLSWMYL